MFSYVVHKKDAGSPSRTAPQPQYTANNSLNWQGIGGTTIAIGHATRRRQTTQENTCVGVNFSRKHVSVAYLQIFCLPNIDNIPRAGTDLRLQVVASIFTLALQEAAPCPWPRLVQLLASEVSTAPHSRLDPAPSAEAEAAIIISIRCLEVWTNKLNR